MPRSEGIETFVSVQFQLLDRPRNECPDQRGLRQDVGLFFQERHYTRNECPDQRGLRLVPLQGIAKKHRPGTNAPIRGD